MLIILCFLKEALLFELTDIMGQPEQISQKFFSISYFSCSRSKALWA